MQSSSSSEQSSRAEDEFESGFNLSTSVKGALKRAEADGDITAIRIAAEILRYHIAYAAGKAKQVLQALNNVLKAGKDTGAGKLTSRQWLAAVEQLFNHGQVKRMHGRLFIVSLAMLDADLRDQLLPDQVLHDLIGELEEDINGQLSASGKPLFDSMLDIYEDNDQLENTDDNPVKNKIGDLLDRSSFAEFVVRLINNTPLGNGSFSIHLHAPWGAGKTSFMNFMKESLRNTPKVNDSPAWYIADFNAWQNQSLPYPWWTFMNNLYDQVKADLAWGFRLRIWFWRMKTKFLHQFVALLACCAALYFLGTTQSGDFAKVLDSTSKIMGALVGIWGIIFSLSQVLTAGSQKAAQYYLESRDNPMGEYHKNFIRIVKAMRSSKLVVFVDDLDRCKSAYVVEFLESLQTLFKEENVLFIIAADMGWLHACYEVEYDKIKSFVNVQGKTIGPLFIEKMFQLSVALPGVPESIKEKCWNAMLGQEAAVTAPDVKEPAETKATGQTFAENHEQRLQTLKSLSTKKTMKQTEHFLVPYSQFLDLNPRNMKRLLNNYLINKASSLISHIDIDKHQLILWTIIQIQWPVLSGYLIRHPDKILDNGVVEAMGIPEEIRQLTEMEEVKAVIVGRGFNKPLKPETVINCGLLFSCITYHSPEKNKSGQPA
ncbi:KAP family P-loop NTPase fold protein [Mucilaginibacter sp. SP1R1]|uniref:KAP family P-loop NTPase fold protein n=1 Tax=Mucilaginibacter sp. SP1R1 TaxID=2723091 RepID=UPI00161EF194|nr:P-loop NTPase fold protein [Mucilaginibacter sp. SP1R1]MBB6150042.1 hypothetical protein [Mucilaginibacter sp. SP1R1]